MVRSFVARAALVSAGLAWLAACSSEDVMRPDVGVGATASAAPAEPEWPAVEPGVEASPDWQEPVSAEPELAAYPRFEAPVVEPAPVPAEEIACRRELKRLGVDYEDLEPIQEGSCGIEHPVKMSAIGRVQVKPAATLTCEMARTFALWTRKELAPAARARYWSGVKTIHQGSSYSCRKIAGSRRLSEHGQGNAIDIMRIELNNGRDIDVRKPGWFAFRQRGFLNTVRADGCSYFTTVLGPGYNADHKDHFHFDIMPRRNGYVACR